MLRRELEFLLSTFTGEIGEKLIARPALTVPGGPCGDTHLLTAAIVHVTSIDSVITVSFIFRPRTVFEAITDLVKGDAGGVPAEEAGGLVTLLGPRLTVPLVTAVRTVQVTITEPGVLDTLQHIRAGPRLSIALHRLAGVSRSAVLFVRPVRAVSLPVTLPGNVNAGRAGGASELRLRVTLGPVIPRTYGRCLAVHLVTAVTTVLRPVTHPALLYAVTTRTSELVRSAVDLWS